jgi:hypothetical protein
MNFPTPSYCLEWLKSGISIGENLNTKPHKCVNNCKICLCIGVASILTNTNFTFQALWKWQKGTKISIRKTVLYICLCFKHKSTSYFIHRKVNSIIFFDTEKNIKFPTLGIHISHKKRRNSQHDEHLKRQYYLLLYMTFYAIWAR